MAGEPRDARDDDEGTEVEMDDDGDGGGADSEDAEPQTLEDWRARAEKLEQDNKQKDLALRKANRERARLGRRTADQPKPKAAAGKPEGEDISRDTLAKLEDATSETKKWRSTALKEKAKLRLASEGVPPKRVERAVKLIDEEFLDLDEDGKLTGIDDQIEDLRDDWPDLFKDVAAQSEEEAEPKRQRPPRDRRANRDAGDKADKGAPAKDVEAQRFEAMFGGRGR